MGRGKRSAIASLFGFKSHGGRSGGERQQQEEDAKAAAAAAAGRQQQTYYHYQPRGRKVRPSDDDDYGRQWYADRDINRRASEFIERVHRGILEGNEQDG
ncbi:hypothetical protein GUJ93_ZPchr0008g12785 [Zizania palustris]|uniref:Uncharacterized protein n=1 Tax=Zizania palustris TaxID=103762 RepID=A0A8J5RU86_ZIZPA|nr:hypothetical protein GUJ93_ZPchr0008g12785 [Zizania palustris]